MMYLNFYQNHEDGYEDAYKFACIKYLQPRMNMKLYYRPSVLFEARNKDNRIVGVMGLNTGFVANNMLSKDRRTRTYMKNDHSCDQSIFALDEQYASIAPHCLSCAVCTYAYYSGAKYLGVLAIPVSRKIMQRLGVHLLSHPNEKSGFGAPDISLLSPEHRDDYITWYRYNNPISMEIVDTAKSYKQCINLLMQFHFRKKVTLSESFLNIFNELSLLKDRPQYSLPHMNQQGVGD